MEMKFEKKLKEFADKYNLEFSKQEFDHVWNDNSTVDTFSIYNDSGCFTIHYLLQRCEYDFYYSKKFSKQRKELMQVDINVFDYEKNIWKKGRVFGFRNPFFYLNFNKVILTLIEVMEALAEETNNIFGVELPN